MMARLNWKLVEIPWVETRDENFARLLRAAQEELAKAVFCPSNMLTQKSLTPMPALTMKMIIDAIDETKRKVESAGVSVGTLTGWRLWNVVEFGLRSVLMNTPWLPGQPMTGDPDAPYAGVYAFREPDKAYQQFYRTPSNHVLGTVKMWGRYVEHERGYRAEFARITSLREATPDVDLAALRELYLYQRVPDRPNSLVGVYDHEARALGITTAQFHLLDQNRKIAVMEPMLPYAPSFLDAPPTSPVPKVFHYRLEKFRHLDGRRKWAILVRQTDDRTGLKWLSGWLPLAEDAPR